MVGWRPRCENLWSEGVIRVEQEHVTRNLGSDGALFCPLLRIPCFPTCALWVSEQYLGKGQGACSLKVIALQSVASLVCMATPGPRTLRDRIDAFGVENYDLDQWLAMYGQEYLEAQLDRLEEMRSSGRLIRSGAVIAAIREDWAGYTQAIEEPQVGF